MNRFFYILILTLSLIIFSSSYILLSSRPGICCDNGCSCNIVKVRLGNCCCEGKTDNAITHVSTPVDDCCSTESEPIKATPVANNDGCCGSQTDTCSEESNDPPVTPIRHYDNIPCDGGTSPILILSAIPVSFIAPKHTMVLYNEPKAAIIPINHLPNSRLLDRRLSKVPI